MDSLALVTLRIDFALHKARTEDISVQDALAKYAGIYRILRRVPPELVSSSLSSLDYSQKNRGELAGFFLKMKKRFSIGELDEKEECFYYNLKRVYQAYLHFNNSVSPRHPMKGAELENRKRELGKIAEDIRKNRPEVRRLKSGSWIWSLTSFQALMPEDFVASLEEVINPETHSYAQFGQFVRYDGTLNTDKAEQFRRTWKFPVKTLEGECGIADFIKLYQPKI
jgi:hypothetical protein